MAEHISDESRKRVDEIVRKVTVAHNLDADIQEELCGHIEDKLLAYVNGEEPVTEDDAFVLVQQHFGDPSTIKAQFQSVHAVDTHISLARRLAAIVVVHVAMFTAVALVQAVVLSGIVSAQLESGQIGINALALLPVNIVVIVLQTAIIWRILAAWERRIRAGQRPWFIRWSAPGVAGVLIGSIILYWLAPIPLSPLGASLVALSAPLPFSWIAFAGLFIAAVLNAVIWLWWCDRPPRRSRTLSYAAAVWIALSVFPLQTTEIVQLLVFVTETGVHDSRGSGVIKLFELQRGDTTAIWGLGTGFSMRYSTPLEFFVTILVCALLLVFAKILYTDFNRITRFAGWKSRFGAA